MLVEGQKASHDLLSHLCLIESRWDAALWIVKKLVEDGPPPASGYAPEFDSEVNVIWPDEEQSFTSLKQLTDSPVLNRRVRRPRKLGSSLDDLTGAPESIDKRRVVLKEALGQVWRLLGILILAASKQGQNGDPVIMPRVLEMLAYLHHFGWIPDAVYAAPMEKEDYSLQQPPILHVLSTHILMALSDAVWNAREASAEPSAQKFNVQHFLGREIPLSRFKIPVKGLMPEIWLELVLWSSLHGGWILDGVAILEHVLSEPRQHEWRVLNWGEALSQQEQGDTSSIWQLFNKRARQASKDEIRALTVRRISSEVIVAFVDGLLNLMRVGVGSRGVKPEFIVSRVQDLKRFLERDGHSLGTASWDSVMIRILESGGVVPETRPEVLLDIARLGPEFGLEVASVNATPVTSTATMEPPYFYEPSTAAIGLLHRTMRSSIENGDVLGATTILNTLIQMTDGNKQRSMELFFQALKVMQSKQNKPFTSSVPPIDFPAFDPQLPIALLGKLLDLATETRSFELGRFLLFSEELDGPLITPEMYEDKSMASSIVRFGTIAGENDLVLRVMKKLDFWNARHQAQRIPNILFTTLLESQIRLHRWETVRNMQQYGIENPRYRIGPGLLATFAAEVLRLSNAVPNAEGSGSQGAWDAFAGLLSAWEGIILAHTKSKGELYCILGVLCSVDEHWKLRCSQFLPFDIRQAMTLSIGDFNKILSGVLDGYGSSKGLKLVTQWCHDAPTAFEPHRAPGGLATMPQYRPGKAKEYAGRPDDIEIAQASGATLRIQGRVLPNRHTARAIVDRVQQEEEQRREKGVETSGAKRAEMRRTLRWAAKLFYSLGVDYEDTLHNLGSLAEIAELEAPPSLELTGVPESSSGAGAVHA